MFFHISFLKYRLCCFQIINWQRIINCVCVPSTINSTIVLFSFSNKKGKSYLLLNHMIVSHWFVTETHNKCSNFTRNSDKILIV